MIHCILYFLFALKFIEFESRLCYLVQETKVSYCDKSKPENKQFQQRDKPKWMLDSTQQGGMSCQRAPPMVATSSAVLIVSSGNNNQQCCC